jgi:hypothetical protein
MAYSIARISNRSAWTDSKSLAHERLIDIFYLKEQSILPCPKLYRTRKKVLVGRFVCHAPTELDANRMDVAPDATSANRHCPREATINPDGRFFDLR